MTEEFLDRRAEDQSSVLHLAAAAGTDATIVDMMRDTLALEFWETLIDRQTSANETALHIASTYADARFVTRLLSYGADANAVIDYENNRLNPLRGNRGTTALHLAVERPDATGVVTALLAGGIDQTWRKRDGGETAVYLAAGNATDVDVLSALLSDERGVQAINLANDEGNTPLMVALARDRPIEAVRFLLAMGADANIANADKVTPLHFATTYASDPAVVMAVMDATDDACVADAQNRTAGQLLDLPTSPLTSDRALARRFHETCVEAAQ
ncbi:hypothetical protein AN189_06255 [Loktanella sp. 3ANDIMAR09]|nr:hypothetical protein AN189_06255 [Loktanella sp. 3ANDIMAR09]